MKPQPVDVFIDGYNLYHGIMDTSRGQPGPNKIPDCRWLDLMGLSRSWLKPHQELRAVHYYTSKDPHNRQRRAKQAAYWQALRDTGVQISLGEFKNRKEKRTDVNLATTMALSLMLDPAVKAVAGLVDAHRAITHLLRHMSTVLSAVESTAALPFITSRRAVQRLLQPLNDTLDEVQDKVTDRIENATRELGQPMPVLILVSGDSDFTMPVTAATQVTECIVIPPPNRNNSRKLRLAATHSWPLTESRLRSHQLPNPFQCRDGTEISCPDGWTS